MDLGSGMWVDGFEAVRPAQGLEDDVRGRCRLTAVVPDRTGRVVNGDLAQVASLLAVQPGVPTLNQVT